MSQRKKPTKPAPAAPEPTPTPARGRPPLYGRSVGGRQRSIYCTDAELEAIKALLKSLRDKSPT